MPRPSHFRNEGRGCAVLEGLEISDRGNVTIDDETRLWLKRYNSEGYGPLTSSMLERTQDTRSETVQKSLALSLAAIRGTGAVSNVRMGSSKKQSVRRSWIDWLSPWFSGNDSAYVTGTYNDTYGYSHGCTLPRNVHKDMRRWMENVGIDSRRYFMGIEKHQYRDVLHWHGIIEGPFDELSMKALKASWESQRGFCRVLPVLDGCASYVTKYALKGDTECFEFMI